MKMIIQIMGVTFFLTGVLFGVLPAEAPQLKDGVHSVEIRLLGLGPRTATVTMQKKSGDTITAVDVPVGYSDSRQIGFNSKDHFLFDGSKVIVKLTDSMDRNEKPLEFILNWSGKKNREYSAVLLRKYTEAETPGREFETKLTVQCIYISPDLATMGISVREIR